ncbi:hypothetical protein BpHYR1_006305 [Brachionus plicatilis]|uniref:Uncharacterized protein n=1 Tax=Brachionus plicatilis TaxID=10195 RepID=A0A3M7RLS0_BRAPC|nr:hypothetical protein BpHYR1_006305 [Brachionus plicatilis]
MLISEKTMIHIGYFNILNDFPSQVFALEHKSDSIFVLQVDSRLFLMIFWIPIFCLHLVVLSALNQVQMMKEPRMTLDDLLFGLERKFQSMTKHTQRAYHRFAPDKDILS